MFFTYGPHWLHTEYLLKLNELKIFIDSDKLTICHIMRHTQTEATERSPMDQTLHILHPCYASSSRLLCCIPLIT
jgi:hypothetical protein